jgi:hypothetical protein
VRRHLFNFLTVLSLALCAAVTGLIIAGSIRPRTISWAGYGPGARYTTESVVAVSVDRSRIGLLFSRRSGSAGDEDLLFRRDVRRERFSVSPGLPSYMLDPAQFADWSWKGFGYQIGPPGKSARDPGVRAWAAWVIAPSWLCSAATLVLPVHWASRLIRAARARARVRNALCPRCGYDLRATPGRCPECGEPRPLVPSS